MTRIRSGPPSLMWPEFETDPYPLYDLLRREFPLVRDEELGGWLLSRQRDVHRAFRDPAFSNRPNQEPGARLTGPTFVGLDGAEHAAYRAVLTPMFRGRVLGDRFAPVVESTARELATAVAGRHKVDLVEEFYGPLPVHITVGLLGLPPEDSGLFRRWYQALLAAGGDYTGSAEIAAAGTQARDDMHAYLTPVIIDRRADPGDDLISMLCTARVRDRPLETEQITALCSLILIAGGESTEKALALTTRNLLENPEQFAAVRADRELLVRAFVETLRRDPPSQFVVKQAVTDVEFPAGPVPAGDTVFLLLGAANRDPEVFADPDSFDLFRPELEVNREFTGAATQLALGGGSHFCLGAHLARLEVETSLRALLDAVPAMRFVEGWAPRDTGRFLRGPAELWVETVAGPERPDGDASGRRDSPLLTGLATSVRARRPGPGLASGILGERSGHGPTGPASPPVPRGGLSRRG